METPMGKILVGDSHLTTVPSAFTLESIAQDREGTKMGIVTKSTDAKGRVCLPKAFANATVIIEQVSENELRIRKARVIPEDEMRFSEEAPIILSDEERERFLRALDHPPEPGAELRRLMTAKAKKRG
jgi:hypothetical protein